MDLWHAVRHFNSGQSEDITNGKSEGEAMSDQLPLRAITRSMKRHRD
jgi:hypothetical protein